MTSSVTIVLSEDRIPRPAQQVLGQALAAALAGQPGVEMLTVPHLYDLAPEGPGVQRLRTIQGDMLVLAWLHPRAIFWVLQANEVRGRMQPTAFIPEEELQPSDGASQRRIWCLDLRGHEEAEPLLVEVARILEKIAGRPLELDETTGETAAGTVRIDEIDETVQPRWYPVIDYGLCKNCLECLNFCLFGTYGLDEQGRVFVEEPGTCRDGCPACSRICPSGAILFPQHSDPAIAGDKAASGSTDLDLTQFLSGDDAQKLANAERQRAIVRKEITPSLKDGVPAQRDDLDRLVDELDGTEL